jgi:hypothetical protein
MQVLLECYYILMESSQWENLNHLSCRKICFLNRPSLLILRSRARHEADLAVYVVSLFQVQWCRCNQANHQMYNYFVKDHHLFKIRDRACFFSSFYTIYPYKKLTLFVEIVKKVHTMQKNTDVTTV